MFAMSINKRRPMPIRSAYPLIFLLAMTTPACSAPMKTPDIQINPSPRMRYEVTLTLEGAPGLFDAVNGFVQYRVTNDRCVPLQPISGATVAPEKDIQLSLTRISDNAYKGIVYADLMRDEDYYGMGMCHWSITAVVAQLKKKAVTFSPDLSSDELLAQKPKITYFWRGDYLDADAERSEMGNTQRSYFKQSLQDELFTVTLAAKEEFP